MSVQTRTRDAMPALAPLYAGAAAQAGRDALSRRSRPAELPGLRLVVAGHRIDEDALRRWREGVGPVDPDALPSVLVHTQVFGAAMALMADPEFPLPLPGMVHLTNTVTHRRPVAAGRPLTVSAEAVGLVLPEPGVGSGMAAEAGVVSAVVRFGAVTEAEIQAYVATGEPLHCAGAFTVDGAGAALVDGVDGDPNAVIGLSVAWLRRATAALGQDFTRLWEPSNAQR